MQFLLVSYHCYLPHDLEEFKLCKLTNLVSDSVTSSTSEQHWAEMQRFRQKTVLLAEFDSTPAPSSFFSTELLFPWFEVNAIQPLMAVVGEKGRAIR